MSDITISDEQRELLEQWGAVGSNPDLFRAELARLAYGRPLLGILDPSDGSLLPPSEWSPDAVASIESVKFDKRGRPTAVKFVGKQWAFRMLGALGNASPAAVVDPAVRTLGDELRLLRSRVDAAEGGDEA